MSAINTATYGLLTANARFNQAATQTVQDASAGNDLVSDFVEQKEARVAFEASISVVKTADAMTGRLLDISA
jgi:hypothetical protein